MRVMRTNPVRTDTREATWDISARDIKRDDKSIMAAKTCKKMVNMYHNHMYICIFFSFALHLYNIIIKCLFEVCQSKQSIEMTDKNV